MARRKRLPRSKAKRGSGKLAALFVLLGAIAVGFALWWHYHPQPTLPQRPEPQRTASLPPPSPHRVSAPAPIPPPARTNQSPIVAPPLTNVPPAARLVTNASPPRAVPPPPGEDGFPRPPQDLLEAQIALARRGFSSGSLDGVNGSQTRAALLAFQRQHGLPESLELDPATRAVLLLDSPPLTGYFIASNDLQRLQPVSKTWLGKSQQSALDYETILELLAERGHASPHLIRRLNPGMDWTNAVAGTEIRLPAVQYPKPVVKAGFISISLSEKKLQAFDYQTNVIAHFPCSIAARVEKRPAGELRVTAIAEDPNYTFNPEVFPESAEGRELGRKLILPPGPNNPVGTAWISLDRPGYGIHGTPNPEQVGRTESHGCFRLANWNASYLVKLVWIGMPVYVEP